MDISTFGEEVNGFFTVIGYMNGEWKPFLKGMNYEAFIIKRK